MQFGSRGSLFVPAFFHLFFLCINLLLSTGILPRCSPTNRWLGTYLAFALRNRDCSGPEGVNHNRLAVRTFSIQPPSNRLLGHESTTHNTQYTPWANPTKRFLPRHPPTRPVAEESPRTNITTDHHRPNTTPPTDDTNQQ